jgi:hypothetical protein
MSLLIVVLIFISRASIASFTPKLVGSLTSGRELTSPVNALAVISLSAYFYCRRGTLKSIFWVLAIELVIAGLLVLTIAPSPHLNLITSTHQFCLGPELLSGCRDQETSSHSLK